MKQPQIPKKDPERPAAPPAPAGIPFEIPVPPPAPDSLPDIRSCGSRWAGAASPGALTARWKEASAIILKTHGIVLGQTPYGSQDKILTLLTSDYGMLQVIVKNPGGKKSRLAAACEVLAYSELCLLEGRVRYILQSADLEENFFGLREDLSALSLAGYLCELTRHLMPQKENGAEILHLLLNTLYLLEKKKRSPAFLKAVYELKLMGLSGFQPDTDGLCRLRQRRRGDVAPAGRRDRSLQRLPPPFHRIRRPPAPTGCPSRPPPGRRSGLFRRPAGKRSSPSSSTPSRKGFRRSGGSLHPFPDRRQIPDAGFLQELINQFHIERLDGYFAALKAATKFHLDGPKAPPLESARSRRPLDPFLPNAVSRETEPSSQGASAPHSTSEKAHKTPQYRFTQRMFRASISRTAGPRIRRSAALEREPAPRRKEKND